MVGFPYFETADPLISDEQGSYVETDVQFTHTMTHNWNHGIGETVTALLDQGMTITQLVEHDSVPWNALPGQMEQINLGEWRVLDRPERLAHSYTLQAVSVEQTAAAPYANALGPAAPGAAADPAHPSPPTRADSPTTPPRTGPRPPR